MTWHPDDRDLVLPLLRDLECPSCGPLVDEDGEPTVTEDEAIAPAPPATVAARTLALLLREPPPV